MPALDQTKYPVVFRPEGTAAKRLPLVILLHGNFGLPPDLAKRLIGVADQIAGKGYLVAVPRYYPDANPHLTDDNPTPYVPILEAVVELATARPDADGGKIGLVGYSLGGGVAMGWMADGNASRVGAFVDFFGKPPDGLPEKLDYFPPTAVLHNRSDQIVFFTESLKFVGRLNPEAELLLVGYTEIDPEPLKGNHVFIEGQFADTNSIERMLAWLGRHLPTPGL